MIIILCEFLFQVTYILGSTSLSWFNYRVGFQIRKPAYSKTFTSELVTPLPRRWSVIYIKVSMEREP